MKIRKRRKRKRDCFRQSLFVCAMIYMSKNAVRTFPIM